MLFLLCLAALPAELSWESWQEGLSLEKALVLTRSGDEGGWQAESFVAEGWETAPLKGDFKARQPTWGPIVWYRATLRLPEGLPPRPLLLKLGKIADFDRCYFNGQLVGENANYRGRLEDELYDIPRVYEIPLALLKPGQLNSLAIRVDNKGHRAGGIMSGDLSISVAQAYPKTVDIAELSSLALIAFYVITGIYFLFLALRLHSNPANLFFGLFCLSLSVFFLSMLQARSLLVPDYGMAMRLRYAALWTALPLFFVYTLIFFRRRFMVAHIVYLGLSFLAQPLAWFLPNLNLLATVNSFFIQPSWIYPFVVILAIVIKQAQASKEAKIMLSLISVFGAILIFDVLRSNVTAGPLLEFPYLSPYGLLVFILGFALILLNRQIRLLGEMEQLFIMATRDRLTGTATRAHLENVLSMEINKAIRYHRPLTIIMADLDDFKRVNDRFGHPAGDIVLKDFGRLLRSLLRSCDLAGRFGGEEFVIILPETTKRGAAIVAHRIQTQQERSSHLIQGKVVTITASLGVAEMGPGLEDGGQLISAADQALYQAKRGGKNRVELAFGAAELKEEGDEGDEGRT